MTSSPIHADCCSYGASSPLLNGSGRVQEQGLTSSPFHFDCLGCVPPCVSSSFQVPRQVVLLRVLCSSTARPFGTISPPPCSPTSFAIVVIVARCSRGCGPSSSTSASCRNALEAKQFVIVVCSSITLHLQSSNSCLVPLCSEIGAAMRCCIHSSSGQRAKRGR